ncbi:phosphate ABC transporter substrate-binding protein PstS [Fimbriiglobus ruber]|uniref:Phosphate-binding protein n=1 Tax=Fimbriiglobus ruber TaxID=1908690 RepID=A0A225CZ22_9BACT|nr:phosphate ABC transporter substrate-binding protein PstS [Fimbriiglobus ruber]OWK34591.1 Phosphate ABC transporter, periplasmic phosphate-binding protein PstS [Fimbriiglobus ruber]
MTRTLRALIATTCSLVPALLAVGCSGKTPPTAATTPGGPATTIQTDSAELSGRGSTFIQPIMKFWTEEFHLRTDNKVKIDYQGTGSGDGVKGVTDKLCDFGCSDFPLNEEQIKQADAKGGPTVHIPLVIGAVVPMYRLDGVDKTLVFSGPVLADIFSGKITKWNDAKLKDLNPGANLPDVSISPVCRADKSGTSFIFTDYLSKVSPEFKKTVGVSSEPKWPENVGTKQQKTDGVAGHITKNNGAIGYVELTYALDTKAGYGAVVNKAGKTVRADLDSITAAAAATLGHTQTEKPYSLHDLTYNLTDAAGDASYPIAALSFAIIYQKQSGPKGKAVVEFLKWASSPAAQELAKKRNFAPLPVKLQKQIHEKLGKVDLVP